MTRLLTFNQALRVAQTVKCLVRGPGTLVSITISKAAARRDYAPAVKGYKAEETVSELDGSREFVAEDQESLTTLWSFDPADQSLLIG